MNDVKKIKDFFGALLNNLSPQKQKQLYQKIGRELIKSQRRRIKANLNPDGTPYAPRKKKIAAKNKKGSIKRRAKMFQKLQGAKYLKTQTRPNGTEISFSGSAANIARVHHFGLIDRVDKKGRIKVKYAERQLLGFSGEDVKMIEELVIQALAGGLK